MAKEVKEIITEGERCLEGQREDTALWGKSMVAKLTVLDKLISGLENGSNIDHCLTLSCIYKNLCN